MSTIGERIRELRKSKNMTQTEFGKKFGIVKSTVSSYETGNSVPDDEIKRAICNYFNVSADYLLGISIQAEKPAENDELETLFKKHSNIRPIEYRSFPVLGKIACGKPKFADEERETVVLADAHIDADFILYADGDSMTGARIMPGDIVFIKKQPVVDNGEIAAVMIDDEATLKRVYYYPEKNKLVLYPENPKYEPLIYINEELNDVRILGKAVAFQSAVR